MMKGRSAAVVLLVLASVLFVWNASLPSARAATLYVGGAGPGNYTTIQSAIDAANPGDTVHVYSGTYFENLTISTAISLIGEDKHSVVVDNGGNGDVISVFANSVKIANLTAMNAGTIWRDDGIRLSSVRNCIIRDLFITGNGRGIHVEGSSNITIEHNNISGNRNWGMYISGSNGNHIKDNTIFDNFQGIHLSGSDLNVVRENTIWDYYNAISLSVSEQNTITRNEIGKGGTRVRLWRSEHNTISSNIFTGTAYGIGLSRSNSNEIINHTFPEGRDVIALAESKGNRFIDNALSHGGFTFSGDLLEHWNSHDIGTSNTVGGKPVRYLTNRTSGTVPLGAGQVILVNCTGLTVADQILKNDVTGILLAYSSDNVITGNSAMKGGEYRYGDSVHLFNSNNNSIVGNTLENNLRGIYLRFSDGNIIHDNLAKGNYRGIEIEFSEDNEAYDNIVQENDQGIRLYSSGGTRILNNSICCGKYEGIYLNSSYDNYVASNVIVSNGYDGLMLEESYGSVIANNTFTGNSDGIFVQFSWDILIRGNTISWNRYYGICVHYSLVKVYHNDLLSNSLQACDDTETNVWDDDYPLGGNYWSDYVGVDVKSGPDQDQPGSDGIGDTPYIVEPCPFGTGPGDPVDRYPLMTKYKEILPKPPRTVQSALSGSTFENVTLSWVEPDNETGHKHLLGYHVYRGTTYDREGSGYELVATLGRYELSLVDGLVGEGDPDDYFYRVCSRYPYGKGACSDTQASKFTLALSRGANLISTPLHQSDDSIETVLQTVSLDGAWFYNSAVREWESYMRSKSYDAPGTVNHTMGIWMNVTEESNLTVAGAIPPKTTIHLYKGWNLVGFPSFNTTYTVADLRAETGATRVEGYDPNPPYFLRVLGDAEALQAGMGYWVRVEADTIWIVSSA